MVCGAFEVGTSNNYINAKDLRLKITVFAFGLLTTLLSTAAHACSCGGMTIEELYTSTHKIVLGRVIKLEIVEGKFEYQKVTIDVLEVFKGSPTKILFADFDSTRCSGSTFDFGRKHLIFLNEKDHTTGYCGGTTPIYDLEGFETEYLKPLRKLRASNITQ